MKSSGKTIRRIIMGILAIAVIIFGVLAFKFYQKVFGLLQIPGEQTEYVLTIPTGTDLDQLKEILTESGVLTDLAGFDWLAEKKNLASHIHPGRYTLTLGMDRNDLINKIRSGTQDPVKVVFIQMRTLSELAGVVGRQIEADSSDLMAAFTNDTLLASRGWAQRDLPALFIPNTYEFYWNTDAAGFVDRMIDEYNRFWNDERLGKARELDLSPVEVTTLASIIVEETNKVEELPKMASVYLNRLEKGYRLQACPTIKYAKNDFTMQRILTEDLSIQHPYNTYLHYGLPPGPITIPSVAAIDAVLNPDENEYLYFSAREDFSGYHYFSKTLSEHNRNARKYQKALNERKIYN
jgi:UPF0755 protein